MLKIVGYRFIGFYSRRETSRKKSIMLCLHVFTFIGLSCHFSLTPMLPMDISKVKPVLPADSIPMMPMGCYMNITLSSWGTVHNFVVNIQNIVDVNYDTLTYV